MESSRAQEKKRAVSPSSETGRPLYPMFGTGFTTSKQVFESKKVAPKKAIIIHDSDSDYEESAPEPKKTTAHATKQSSPVKTAEFKAQDRVRSKAHQDSVRSNALTLHTVITPLFTLNSPNYGQFPNLVHPAQADELPPYTKEAMEKLENDFVAKAVCNTTTDVITQSEIDQDIDLVLQDLINISNNECRFYPPVNNFNILSMKTAREIFAISRQFGFVWVHPMNSSILQHICNIFALKHGKAVWRCSTLLDAILHTSFADDEGGLPKNKAQRDIPFEGAPYRNSSQGYWDSFIFNDYLAKTALGIQARIDEAPRIRNVDLLHVWSHRASLRLGWTWSPTWFKLHASFSRNKNVAPPCRVWTDEELSSIHVLLHHQEKNANNILPLYRLRRQHLLHEDVHPIRHQRLGLDATRSKLATTFSPFSLLCGAHPSARSTRKMLNSNESKKATTEEVKQTAGAIFAMYDVHTGNRPQRTLRLIGDADTSSISKAMTEDAISKGLYQCPMQFNSFNNDGKEIGIEFYDEIHLASALAILNVWSMYIKEQTSCSLKLPATYQWPEHLRTLYWLPATVHEHTSPPAFANHLHTLGHVTATAWPANYSLRESSSNVILAKVNDYWQTLSLLQDERAEPEGRAILNHRYTIVWCPQCNKPGHSNCKKEKVVQCQHCPTFHNELLHHTVTLSQPEIVAMKAGGDGISSCTAKRSAQTLSDTMWYAGITRCIGYDGMYSGHVDAIKYRLGTMAGSVTQAFGFPPL